MISFAIFSRIADRSRNRISHASKRRARRPDAPSRRAPRGGLRAASSPPSAPRIGDAGAPVRPSGAGRPRGDERAPGTRRLRSCALRSTHARAPRATPPPRRAPRESSRRRPRSPRRPRPRRRELAVSTSAPAASVPRHRGRDGAAAWHRWQTCRAPRVRRLPPTRSPSSRAARGRAPICARWPGRSPRRRHPPRAPTLRSLRRPTGDRRRSPRRIRSPPSTAAGRLRSA